MTSTKTTCTLCHHGIATSELRAHRERETREIVEYTINMIRSGHPEWAANDPTQTDPNTVGVISMTAGITLANWFKGEARRVYAMLSESDDERDERRLVERIERKGGSVTAREVRRPNGGRPHFLYTLTEEGHRRLSEGYDRLVSLLVRGAGALDTAVHADPDARRRELFRLAAGSLAERYRSETVALSGEPLVERLAGILREHGGFADWHAIGGALELRDFNCVFRANVAGDGPCDWHETFLSTILEAPVQASSPDGCAECCSYIIPARSAPSLNGSTP